MKQFILKKGIFSVILVFMISCIVHTNIYANNTLENQEVNNRINVPYSYPVLPGTDEWNMLDTHIEKVKVCQIPDEVLTNMTTEALAKTVLNYPLMSDMLAYELPVTGYNAIYSSFNGLVELQQRTDAVYEIEKLNIESVSHSKLNNNLENLNQVYLKVIFYLIGKEETFIENIQENRASSIAIKTPNGTTFYAQYGQTWEDFGFFAETDAKNAEVQYRKIYPNATKVSPISPSYNCHSYAWYTTSSSNLVWINDSGAYMADGSYRKISAPIAGCKVYQSINKTPVHSGIVVTLTMGGANRVGIKSKWGTLGVYEHYIYDSPYSYDTSTYWK